MPHSPVVTRLDGAVSVITIDHPPVNAMAKPVRTGLIAALESAAADAAVRAVVITGQGRTFIAGADVKEMNQAPEPPFLPDVVAALEAFGKPLVAAINGTALGGGLEIALACDLRIAAPRASLGLPETRLGIVPGAGGTQRLPRLTGTARAIDMIANARIVRADEAAALGIVDAIADDPLQAALDAAPTLQKRRVSAEPVPGNDADAAAAGVTAARRKAKDTPAIAQAIRLVELAATTAFADGLAEERKAFLTLRDSDEASALRYLFFAERAAEKVPGVDGLRPGAIAKAGVIGAGTMGAAIAAALADAGLDVQLVERDAQASETGASRVADLYNKLAAGGRLTAEEAAKRRARIVSTTDWNVLAGVDVVIEAAFESMEVKTGIFRRLDAIARPGAMLASNTSYLDLDAIAAATRRPGDVVGLHFFAPANVMRLLEIVRGKATSAETLSTALALAKSIGKQPVVSGNAYGFIGNRIYAAYRRHAEYMMEDGASPYEIDAALRAYGLAMGVFEVSDLSGLDISYAMRRSLDATRDPGERYVAIADRLVESGRLGRKAGAGYYSYASGKPKPDPETERIVAAERAAKGIAPQARSADGIRRRLAAVMANEGAAILSAGIAMRASDIDLVYVNGYGFPRAKGGPMWAADHSGLAGVVAELEMAASENPGAIVVSPLLRRLVDEGQRLSDWDAART